LHKIGSFCWEFSQLSESEHLAAALRAVESPERRGVFEVLCTASQLFMDFGGVEQKDGEVIKFVGVGDPPQDDLTAAAWLLPVILD
jgi:hypothetical protein